MKSLQQAIEKFPRAHLTHTPTPLEKLPPLSRAEKHCEIYVKRDDCTGLAMGGNKARQLEFYLGEAQAQGFSCVVSGGAVQSNHLRMLAAGAAKLGMECHLQLQQAEAQATSDEELHSGNVLLGRLLGATLHRCAPDSTGANEYDDATLEQLAHDLSARASGRKPYVISLGKKQRVLGALGYIRAAQELAQQIAQLPALIDLLITPSGSGLTHAGLLVGLRALGIRIPLIGVCVRRPAAAQRARVLHHCQRLAELLNAPETIIDAEEVQTDDSAFAPGYAHTSPQVKRDIRLLASRAALLTDPVYSGKTFSAALNRIRANNKLKRVIIIHSGGTPGLFAYRSKIVD